jgi:bifunctional DNase/RNase
MIRLDLVNVGVIEETGGILLVLRAAEQERLLVIETGVFEGRAIAMEAEGVRAEPPLTHDLLHDAIIHLGARISEVQIGDLRDDTFFAKVILTKGDGAEPIALDSRSSDAIALALRASAPIYVAEAVMSQASIPEDREGRFAELYTEPEPDKPPEGHIVH